LKASSLFVANLANARAFYAGLLNLPTVFEDEIIVVIRSGGNDIVLHRNDRGHDDRDVFPAGSTAGAPALRFVVADPDACERRATTAGATVLWPAQDATWGRFVLLRDPDGRPVVLTRMNAIA